MTTSDSHKKRKTFLINRPFQINFIRHNLILAFVVLAIIYGSQSYHFHLFRQQGHEVGLEANHIFFEFIGQQQESMNWIFLATGLVVGLLIVLNGLLLSHRVAGPLYRLQTYLTSKKKGEAKGPLKFRDGDYFPEIADAINEFTDTPGPRA